MNLNPTVVRHFKDTSRIRNRQKLLIFITYIPKPRGTLLIPPKRKKTICGSIECVRRNREVEIQKHWLFSCAFSQNTAIYPLCLLGCIDITQVIDNIVEDCLLEYEKEIRAITERFETYLITVKHLRKNNLEMSLPNCVPCLLKMCSHASVSCVLTRSSTNALCVLCAHV